MNKVKKLLTCVGRYKKYAILAPIVVICEGALDILIPFLMSKIIDVGIANGDVAYVVKIGVTMIVMALVSLVLGALSGRFAAVAGMGFGKNIRKKLFDKVQDFSFGNTDKFSTASLVTRLTTDVTNTQNAFMMVIRMLARAPFMMICATVMAIKINAQLAIIYLFAIPVLGVALYFIATRAYPRFQAMLKKYDKLNAQVEESLIAIRVVKAFVRRDYENQKFEEAADGLRVMQKRAEKLIILNGPAMQIVMYTCMICICWFGGNMIIAGGMQTGELMSFISYLTQILMSLMMLSMIFVMLVMSQASVTRITEVLDETVDIPDNEGGLDILEDGSIEFKNVSFSYAKDPDNQTLSHINLSIRSGETVGIIGGTGTGKTTLVQLIPRLYDVLEGELLVGGHDVREYQLEALRGGVAMVLQKNVLFSGTIRENLKWGNENATDDEIVEACKAAEAHDFIMSFPNGYETELGQGGVNVSGGQKQRLCIARALLKKPQIIILDDSTSAVDTATDSRIRKALREELTGTTTIIIAQRVTSVSDADKIVVLDDEGINAVGTHEELLNTNEIYREVYESQQKGAA
jgi:ATP-binding cassette subfamily B multidrug efflux pump